MADGHPRLIVNSRSLPCGRCGGVHTHITRLSDDAPCDTPVAFGIETAISFARSYASGEQDVIRIPRELAQLVVMDDSARRLPRRGSQTMRYGQFELVVRSA